MSYDADCIKKTVWKSGKHIKIKKRIYAVFRYWRQSGLLTIMRMVEKVAKNDKRL